MSGTVSRFATEEPTACAVCRRHAVWLGYGPPKRERPPVIWLCDDNACHAAAKKVYAMPKEMLDAYEIGAALEAGAEGGAYLEEISKTDIATLAANGANSFAGCSSATSSRCAGKSRTTSHRFRSESHDGCLCAVCRKVDRARLRRGADRAGDQAAGFLLCRHVNRPCPLAEATQHP